MCKIKGTQPETPQTCCKLWFLPAWCKFVNKLEQACQFHQVAASLWKSDLLQLDICRLAASCWNNLYQACEHKVSIMKLHQACWQLAADLLSSSLSKRCERILISAWWQQGNKPAADVMQLARSWLCKTHKYYWIETYKA